MHDPKAFDVAMSTMIQSFRARFLLGFLACAGLIGYALYVQFVERLMPCNYCILQRIAFAALGLVFLVGGLHGPRSPRARGVYVALALMAALIGIGIAGRHVWVQLYPPPMSMCGAGLGFLAQMQGWPGAIRQVLTASGDCSNIDWKFLGLTMPMWSLLWFAALAIWAALAARVRGGTRR